MANAFGEFLKKKRLESGVTLRAFCRENELDVGNMSKIERGVMGPPKARAVLEGLAKALGLKKGTEDWETFFDLAAISAGRIPDQIMEDEEQIAKLPLVFRTVAGRKLTRKQLRELAEMIRHA